MSTRRLDSVMARRGKNGEHRRMRRECLTPLRPYCHTVVYARRTLTMD